MTGQTNQIRLHLQHIGFPIANYPKYGGVTFNDFDIETAKNHHEETKLEDDELKELYTPKLVEDMCLKFWLHAFQYIYKGKTYETKKPAWAEEGYKVSMKFE
jgi:23S rRNA-/tRNA-specific pseudouridylate synthase